MSWQKLELMDLGLLENFLIKNELECVTFSAWLKEKIISQAHLQRDLAVYINKNKNHLMGADSISEALLVTEYGMICPIIQKNSGVHPHRLQRLSYLIHQTPCALSSIMGLEINVKTVEKLLINRIVKSRVDYYLMVLDKAHFHDNSNNLIKDITIRKARTTDAAALFDIQKRYELEEVCLNPYLFDDNACLSLLKNNLRKEIIFIAEKNGKPFAKAGTNARGYNIYQIGGVFTRQEYRRHGIAHSLMLELLKYIFRLEKTACLFVKKINKPAFMLYKKLGFKIVSDFRISYI
ncbi:MAG: GNAT family N-acetyltransferase [Spirochaetales bacterium]|nr:GNAT family N-acetyltransferase [Spirochaetales bacterium]